MMRRFLRIAVFAVAMLAADSGVACEKCHEYFNPQNYQWCKECVPASCGMFRCEIRQVGTRDECSGEWGCFVTGYGCGFEPEMRRDEDAVTPRLADLWRLTSARTIPARDRSPGGGMRPAKNRT